LIEKLNFVNFNQFSMTKVNLNLIIFGHWIEICEMTTTTHIVSLRAFQQYQKCNEEPHNLGGLMLDCKTKEVPI
jgi:hypothetical protein